MIRPNRIAGAVLAIGALLAVPGCAVRAQPEVPGAAAPARETGLESTDPCALLTEDELAARGAWPPGYPNRNVPAEPGCDYDGDPFGYSFFKNQEMTVESYGAQGNWAKFDRRELNGRAAANAINASSTGGRICSTMFDAGGGVIIVTAGELNDEGRDECAESWQVAELVEPKMPR
ncbi:DUF3558 family protein [Saccharopolyspora sp. NFXS83]|uniref:DUF3558 family protein n=1 Tax=Saccharopolyspora sp. NFXS83 TaxID=2993560 RepID=UPI00224AD278|nr:DUF3558 family protein [Saccharopolyspora sp. NFXS83]MCX2733378.1 DUF3558 family protein [Saccharopolyspora sp. NFXS83]